jgi:hypothetical protein
MGLSVAANDQWNQQWTIAPVTDVDQLRKLKVLYQFGSGQVPPRSSLLCNYPINRKKAAASDSSAQGASGSAGGSSSTQVTINNILSDKLQPTVKCGGNNRQQTKYYIYCPRTDQESFAANEREGSPWLSFQDADEAFLSPPNCVICADSSPKYKRGGENAECDKKVPSDETPAPDAPNPRRQKSNGTSQSGVACLHVNFRLKNQWLHFSDTEPSIPPSAIIIGEVDGIVLYVNKIADIEDFREFVFFVLEAVQQTSIASTIVVPPVVVPQ